MFANFKRPLQTKTLVLVAMMAGLTMGNEGCEQANQRVLKMDVELGTIAAQKVTLPTGEQVDFAFVANSLFYQQVMANRHFVLSNPVPTIPNSQSGQAKLAGALSTKSVSKLSRDEKVLSQFGFMQQLESKALNSEFGVRAKSLSQSVAVDPAEIPQCLYDLPQAKLAGEVVSFEANWGVGVGIGYGADGATIPTGGSVAGSVQFKSARLQTGLRAIDPMNDLLLASAAGVSTQSTLNFGIDFASALLGLDLFYQTPLAKVVTSALDKSLDAVVKDLIAQRSSRGSWDDVWESRVIYDPEVSDNDTHIVFRGGYRYGMQVGDSFTVTNQHYKWEDDSKPCESALKYKVPLTPTPIAEVEVIAVGDNVAVAKVTKYLIEQNIKPGAQVKLLKLFTPKAAPKKTK